MPENTFFDINGNPLGLPSKTSTPQPKAQFYDVEGNPITSSPTSQAQAQPQNDSSGFFSRTLPQAASESLPVIGGMVGGALAAPTAVGEPAGVVLGGALGSSVDQLLKTWRPQNFGPPSENPTETAILQGEMQQLPVSILNKLGEGWNAAKSALVRKVFSNVQTPEVSQAMATTGAPASYGQLSGNRGAKIFEDAFAPKELSALEESQKQGIQNQVQQYLGRGPDQTIKEAGKETVGRVKFWQKVKNNAYDDLTTSINNKPPQFFKIEETPPATSSVLGPNGQPIQTAGSVNLTPIKGAIVPNVSRQMAGQVSSALDELELRDPTLQSEVSSIKARLSPLMQETKIVDVNGQPVQDPPVDYNSLKALRDSINRYIGPKLAEGHNPPQIATLKNFADAIGQDIDTGIQNMGDPAIIQKQQLAKQLNQKYVNLTDPQLSQQLQEVGNRLNSNGVQVRNTDLEYETLANKAYSGLNSLRQFLHSTGDRDLTTEIGLSNLVRKGIDSDGSLRPEAVLTELNKNQQLYSEGIKSQPRTNFINFLKTVKGQEPISNKSIIPMLVTLRMAGATVALGSELFTGHVGATLPTIGLYLGARDIAKSMVNPTIARAMINGAKLPLAAGGSSALGKVIMNGLKYGAKGAFVPLINEETGQRLQGVVTDDGKIRLQD